MAVHLSLSWSTVDGHSVSSTRSSTVRPPPSRSALMDFVASSMPARLDDAGGELMPMVASPLPPPTRSMATLRWRTTAGSAAADEAFGALPPPASPRPITASALSGIGTDPCLFASAIAGIAEQRRNANTRTLRCGGTDLDPVWSQPAVPPLQYARIKGIPRRDFEFPIPDN